jgi:hypothetical protein
MTTDELIAMIESDLARHGVILQSCTKVALRMKEDGGWVTHNDVKYVRRGLDWFPEEPSVTFEATVEYQPMGRSKIVLPLTPSSEDLRYHRVRVTLVDLGAVEEGV